MSEHQNYRRIQIGENSYEPFGKKTTERPPTNIEQRILDKIDALQKSIDELRKPIRGDFSASDFFDCANKKK